MIYVHDNPQNLEYNALLYVFMRHWYCPELPDHVFHGDTWFKVPAIRVETKDRVSYTIINSKIEMSAMMMLSDNGRLMKANRVNLDQKVPDHQLKEVEREAFDISQWEKANQTSFPYGKMFDSALVNARYRTRNGANTEAYFSISSTNQLFSQIKKVVSPKPCNCGKGHYLE